MKQSRLFVVLLILMSFIMLRGDLFFVSNEGSRQNLMRYIVLFLGIFGTLLVLSAKDKKRLEYRFALKYTLVVTIVALFFMFYTKELYGYTLYQVFTMLIPFLFNIASFMIIYVMLRDSYRHKILDVIYLVTMLFMVVRFVAWFTYNYMPIHLFENFALEYAEWQRNGIKRLVSGCLFGVAFVVALTRFADNKKNVESLVSRRKMAPISLAFLFVYCFFVTQSRYGSAMLIVTFIVTMYLTRKGTVSRMALIFGSLVCVVILTIGGLLPEFINSFSVNSSYGASTLARLDGVEHFWNLFITKGNKFGLGFIVNGYGSEEYFYKTSWLNYYLGDLGIVGSFFRYGFFTFIIYGWLFLKAILVSIRALKERSPYTAVIISTSCHMILSCLMSDIYDYSVAFAMPFYIAIISYVDGKEQMRSKQMQIVEIR